MKRKLSRVVFRRRALVMATLLVQIAFFVFLIARAGIYFHYTHWILNFLSIIVCIHVLNRRTKAAYKMTWIFLIMLFPFFGGIMYIYFHWQSNPRKLKRLIEKNFQHSRSAFSLGADRLPDLSHACPESRPQAHYLQNSAGFPVCANTLSTYFDSGEGFFRQVLAEMEKAERYIFLEFFILSEGAMLDPIMAILERKAREGLDVRIMYDDVGCFMSLPANYQSHLKEKGIKCYVFNPFRPLISSLQNNRDHRKLIIIDGKVAFTGGMNLADEYINAVNRFGKWKDAAVMLEGEGAWPLALIFLQMWNTSHSKEDSAIENFEAFYPWENAACKIESDGFVQPYADNPIDEENIGEHVYIQIINTAKQYVFINTPYLILGDNLLSALSLAAKSGVDVRIITPHRWDKWIVAMTSRSYYRQLIAAGVKIYEYSAGFNHGKTFVCDDALATVGTTNLDFRSLYLHFECGVLLYRTGAVQSVKDDFLQTIPASHQISLKECSANAFQRIFLVVLRIFAPLM